VILDPAHAAAGGSAPAMSSPTRSLRILLFNPTSGRLDDVALRQALACVVDQREFSESVQDAAALTSLVPQEEGSWYNAEARLPCAGSSTSSRVEQASRS